MNYWAIAAYIRYKNTLLSIELVYEKHCTYLKKKKKTSRKVIVGTNYRNTSYLLLEV